MPGIFFQGDRMIKGNIVIDNIPAFVIRSFKRRFRAVKEICLYCSLFTIFVNVVYGNKVFFDDRTYGNIAFGHCESVGVIRSFECARTNIISSIPFIACCLGKFISEGEIYSFFFSCVVFIAVLQTAAAFIRSNAADRIYCAAIRVFLCCRTVNAEGHVLCSGDGVSGFALCCVESACIVAVGHRRLIAAVERSAGIVTGACLNLFLVSGKLGGCVDSVADSNIGIFPA